MKKLFSIFAALTLSAGLWAANSVITFTSTGKLYPGSINEFMMENSKWEAFKVQYPEFASVDVFELEERGINFFNPNAFLDADGQVLNYTIDYDESTHAGTITFAGELVTMYGNDNTGVYAFIGCSSLTSITLPEGLTSIGEYSFRSCSSLASVTLPESLTTIATVAFANCTSLTSITIPANVTEIGYGAFISCSGLTDFYVAMTTLPTIEGNLFLYASIGSATLHVPAGTKALYQNADQWKNFGSFVEYVPQEVKDAAIAAVNGAIAEGDNLYVKEIATHAVSFINEATNVEVIDALKTQALSNIAFAKAAYGEGKTAGYNTGHTEGEEAGIAVGQGIGYQQAKDELPTEGDCGPTVIITKGDKTLTLYNVDNVEYKVTECGGYK